MARVGPAVLAIACCLPGAAASAGAAPAPACLALASSLAGGDLLNPALTRAVPCTDEAPPPPLSFDRRAGALVATAAMPAGTYLGRLALRAGAVFRAGEQLWLVYQRGPVAIEREVRLLTPARPGQRALVRTEDGAVFAFPFFVSRPAAPGAGAR